MSVAEYEAVRATPNRFFVLPGDEHVAADERVVEKTERYWIVEKLGRGGGLPAATDPRS